MPFLRCRAQNSAGCPPPSCPKYGCTEQPPGCRHRAAVTFTAPAGACSAQYLAAPVGEAVGGIRAAVDSAAADADGAHVLPSDAPVSVETSRSAAIGRLALLLLLLVRLQSLGWFPAVVDDGGEGGEKVETVAAAALLEGNRLQPGCKHVLCFVSTMPSSLCS